MVFSVVYDVSFYNKTNKVKAASHSRVVYGAIFVEKG